MEVYPDIHSVRSELVSFSSGVLYLQGNLPAGRAQTGLEALETREIYVPAEKYLMHTPPFQNLAKSVFLAARITLLEDRL